MMDWNAEEMTNYLIIPIHKAKWNISSFDGCGNLCDDTNHKTSMTLIITDNK